MSVHEDIEKRGEEGLTVNSRAKGKAGELSLVHKLKEYGYENARRSQQFAGINGDADVVGVSDLLHIECKVTDVGHGKNYEWLEQAQNDARDGEIPVVIHRRSSQKIKGKPWLATLSLDDFMRIWRCYEKEWSE